MTMTTLPGVTGLSLGSHDPLSETFSLLKHSTFKMIDSFSLISASSILLPLFPFVQPDVAWVYNCFQIVMIWVFCQPWNEFYSYMTRVQILSPHFRRCTFCNHCLSRTVKHYKHVPHIQEFLPLLNH